MIDYSAEIAAAAAAYPSVPPAWIAAVIGAESSFAPITRTWEGNVNEYSYGPMQILKSTAAGLGFSESDISSSRGSILAGTAYIAELIGRYGLDFRRMYSAYNSGNPDRWTQADTIGQRVAANVARAETWLEQMGAEFAEAAGDTSPLLWIAAAFLVFRAWRSKAPSSNAALRAS